MICVLDSWSATTSNNLFGAERGNGMSLVKRGDEDAPIQDFLLVSRNTVVIPNACNRDKILPFAHGRGFMHKVCRIEQSQFLRWDANPSIRNIVPILFACNRKNAILRVVEALSAVVF